MELLEGRDLAQAIRENGPLPPGEVLHVVQGVAAALTEAHEKGIVHRDIKPANVFLCSGAPRPFVKLVDFGIAKRLEDLTLTSTNAFVGTPSYMSPEQIHGARVDHRTDLWSLGVLTYVALTGERPFRGDNLGSMVHAISTAPPPKATSVRPDLPPAIDAWFERALDRDTAGRFDSATEMADALARALSPGAVPDAVRAREEHGSRSAATTEPATITATAERPASTLDVAARSRNKPLPSSPARGARTRALVIAAVTLAVGIAGVRLASGIRREDSLNMATTVASEVTPAASPSQPQSAEPPTSGLGSASSSLALPLASGRRDAPAASPTPRGRRTSPAARPRGANNVEPGEDDIGF